MYLRIVVLPAIILLSFPYSLKAQSLNQESLPSVEHGVGLLSSYTLSGYHIVVPYHLKFKQHEFSIGPGFRPDRFFEFNNGPLSAYLSYHFFPDKLNWDKIKAYIGATYYLTWFKTRAEVEGNKTNFDHEYFLTTGFDYSIWEKMYMNFDLGWGFKSEKRRSIYFENALKYQQINVQIAMAVKYLF